MEAWRRELYHNELYHYGVKGMKWGEHKFGDDELDPDAAREESDSIEQKIIDLVRSGRNGNTRSTSRQTSSETKRMLDGLKEAKAKEYRARLIKNSNKSPSDLSENEYKAATNSAMKDAEKYVSQLVKDYEIGSSHDYDEEEIKKQMTHSELYHYGTKHHSGRYPYGSGDRPYQDVEGRVLKKEAKRLQKEINKAEADSAAHYLSYQRHSEVRKYAKQKADKAASKGKIKAAIKWTERTEMLDKRLDDIYSKGIDSAKKADRLIKQASDTKLYDISYSRRTATNTTFGANLKESSKYIKENGRYYFRDTFDSANRLEYDKTNIRVKKGDKKRKPLLANNERKGYKAYRVNYYYY